MTCPERSRREYPRHTKGISHWQHALAIRKWRMENMKRVARIMERR